MMSFGSFSRIGDAPCQFSFTERHCSTRIRMFRKGNIGQDNKHSDSSTPKRSPYSRQVFDNLLFNAMRYMGVKSNLIIKFLVKDKSNFVFTRISYNGVGIPSELQGRVFA